MSIPSSSISCDTGTDETLVCNECSQTTFSDTPTPSYNSNCTSMGSLNSLELTSVHSEVESEYSTVLSTITNFSCIPSSITTRIPSMQNIQSDPCDDEIKIYGEDGEGTEDNPTTELSSIVCSSEKACNSQLCTCNHRDYALSPISISSDGTILLPYSHNPQNSYGNPETPKSRRQLLFKEEACEHYALNAIQHSKRNKLTNNISKESLQRIGSMGPCCVNDSNEYDVDSNNVKCPCSTPATMRSLSPIHEKSAEIQEDRDSNKRSKRPFVPVNRNSSSSIDDLSVHSFKLRKLKENVTHHRLPDLDISSPSLSSDRSEGNTITNISFTLSSSGDSSQDEAILALSIARAYALQNQHNSLHCPTPATNFSLSNSPLYSANQSKDTIDTSSEYNSSQDEAIIQELTKIAFSKNGNNLSDSSEITASSIDCCSPKVRKKVRFDNDPKFITQLDITSPPVIRHTRSSQLRAQCGQKKKHQYDIQDKQKSKIINTRKRLKILSSNSSSISSLPIKHAKKQ